MANFSRPYLVYSRSSKRVCISYAFRLDVWRVSILAKVWGACMTCWLSQSGSATPFHPKTAVLQETVRVLMILYWSTVFVLLLDQDCYGDWVDGVANVSRRLIEALTLDMCVVNSAFQVGETAACTERTLSWHLDVGGQGLRLARPYCEACLWCVRICTLRSRMILLQHVPIFETRLGMLKNEFSLHCVLRRTLQLSTHSISIFRW